MKTKRYVGPVPCAMKRGRPKTRTLGMVILICAVAVCSADAVPLDVNVATDKPIYSVGEDITVTVTAYNPNDYAVMLEFFSTLQASYIMDSGYDWSVEKPFDIMPPEVIIGPGSSFDWTLAHDDSSWFGGYDLSVGTHSVVGALQPVSVGSGEYTYYSQPVEFEVIPEPATFGVLLLGGLAAVRRRWR